jgi:hypothetical protein
MRWHLSARVSRALGVCSERPTLATSKHPVVHLCGRSLLSLKLDAYGLLDRSSRHIQRTWKWVGSPRGFGLAEAQAWVSADLSGAQRLFANLSYLHCVLWREPFFFFENIGLSRYQLTRHDDRSTTWMCLAIFMIVCIYKSANKLIECIGVKRLVLSSLYWYRSSNFYICGCNNFWLPFGWIQRLG